jgi:hypothetical protein
MAHKSATVADACRRHAKWIEEDVMGDQPVRPEDVLPDGAEGTEYGGEYVRKGSVAAFVGNVQALSGVEPSTPQWEAIVAQMRELKPALDRIGVLEVFEIRDPAVRALVDGL